MVWQGRVGDHSPYADGEKELPHAGYKLAEKMGRRAERAGNLPHIEHRRQENQEAVWDVWTGGEGVRADSAEFRRADHDGAV